MKTMEELKGMSREERMAYFRQSKSALENSALESVNGGKGDTTNNNPNSSGVDDKGNYYSSWGYSCAGRVVCS